MQAKPFPNALAALIVGIAVFNGLAHYFSWYYHFIWLDKPMHFLGGYFIAASFFWLWFERLGHPRPAGGSALLKFLGVGLLASILLGGLWEVYEYCIHLALFSPWSAADTAGDLVFDLLGAAAAALVAFFRDNAYA